MLFLIFFNNLFLLFKLKLIIKIFKLFNLIAKLGMEQNLMRQKEELILKIRALKKKKEKPRLDNESMPAHKQKTKKEMTNYFQIKSLLFSNN